MTSQDPGLSLFLVFFASIVENNKFPNLLSCSRLFSLGVKDNNESRSLLSSPSFFSLSAKWKTWISAHCHLWLFSFSCGKQQWAFQLIVILYILFSCRRRQQAERLDIISWFFPQVQKTRMNQEACCHFLVFFLGVEDDNEPPGLSSSLGFFLQM